MKWQNSFGHFIKSLKNDAFGMINTLRENGILKTDTLDKASICNRQFKSAFTRDTEIHPNVQAPSLQWMKLQLPQRGHETVEQLENS